MAGKPAAKALQSGDKILAVDGRSFPGIEREARLKRFRDQVASHKCAGKQVQGCEAATPVALRVSRDGEIRTISITPVYEKAAGRALLGFSYGTEPTEISISTATTRSADTMWLVVERTGSVFVRIFESEQRKQISGIVGISDVGNQVIDIGVWPSLLLLGLVSLSLGLINLLPFLPLDGGHIFWSLVEKLRGQPVSMRVMERATVVGFALVDDAVFHRTQQRHRAAWRGRVRHPLAGQHRRPDNLSIWLPNAKSSSAACRSAAVRRSPCRP